MQRLSQIPPSEWPIGMKQATSLLLPPVGESAPRDPGRPRGKGVLETFAHHPDLARAFFTFNRHVLWETSLQPRWRHILIMRVAVRRSCQFLYTQHFFQALDAGLSREEIQVLGVRPSAPMPDPLELALSQAVDDFVDLGHLSAETWQLLVAHLNASEQQILDVIFTIGCYLTVAAFMDSVGLEVDPATAAAVGAS